MRNWNSEFILFKLAELPAQAFDPSSLQYKFLDSIWLALTTKEPRPWWSMILITNHGYIASYSYSY